MLASESVNNINVDDDIKEVIKEVVPTYKGK